MVLSVVTRGMIDPSVMRTLLASHSSDLEWPLRKEDPWQRKLIH